MTPSISLEKLLPIGSFAIALAGLIIRLICPSGPRKETMIVTVISFLALMTGVALHEAHQHDQRVHAVSKEIVTIIGNDIKTFDQVYEALFKVDFAVANEAIDILVASNKVGHKFLELHDDSGDRIRVRGYYVRSFENLQ